MDNLKIYNAVRAVPSEAKKEIKGGRMNGKTDINPMWRIKILTEQFGICGIGWKYEIVKFWCETGSFEQQSAFAQINLFIKDGDKWSDAIPGIGGSAFVAKETSGLYTSDECYKMALTDAISVSCKALGVGADVYWDKDNTKYDKSSSQNKETKQFEAPPILEARVSTIKVKVINEIIKKLNLTDNYIKANLAGNYKVASVEELSESQGDKILLWLNGKRLKVETNA